MTSGKMIYIIKTNLIYMNNVNTMKLIFFSLKSEWQELLVPVITNEMTYNKCIFLCEVDIVATSGNKQSV